jgi:hypothetical protein
MITEIVLWKMPEGMSREEILTKFRASVPTWQANPNLVHKAFLFDESSRRGGGVYLWKNIDAAKQAHGQAFQDRIKSVFGASPEITLPSKSSIAPLERNLSLIEALSASST